MRMHHRAGSLYPFVLAATATLVLGASVIALPASVPAVAASSGTIACSTFPNPPAGFDPATASDSQLAQYGFPPRPPVGTPAYQPWLQAMEAAKTPVNTCVLDRTPITPNPQRFPTTTYSPATSSHFAGYIADVNGDSYTEAYGDIYVPPIDSTSGNAAHWIGIGNSGVVQDGISQSCSSSCSSKPFYEFYPNKPGYPAFTINTGDEIYVDAYCTANCSGGSSNTSDVIHISDVASGQYANPSGSTGTYPVNYAAEWFTECPTTQMYCPDLLDFNYVNFDNGNAKVNGSYETIYAANGTQTNMVDSSNNDLAIASALGSSGTDFTVTWKRSS